MKNLYCDVVIAGCGVAGLFTALHLPEDKKIVMLSKGDFESCDSMLAQGGICMLRNETDYESFYEDTMKAGHYENRAESVDLMIRNSQSVIKQLVSYGVEFNRNVDGSLAFTREGAHSAPRICYHQDVTGKEITTKLLAQVQKLSNVTLMEYITMTDILTSRQICTGMIAKTASGEVMHIHAADTVMATGGIGGLYTHSTNFPLLTGDACSIARKHNVELEHMDYVQIHPTSLYSTKPGRSFLISESARGEGAILLNHKGERFINELQPRDVVANGIFAEMETEKVDHEWLSFENVSERTIDEHFPNIYKQCLEEGYDLNNEPIPIVPAQHYFMGGVHVDQDSQTTMKHLYAVGETSCNGVHGKNRLASNSLLESLVFAEQAATSITANEKGTEDYESNYHAACC